MPPTRQYGRTKRRRRHDPADTAQQIVGGFPLAGPFVVTQEVWMLARNVTASYSLFLVGAVVAIGYGGLYGADDSRDPAREAAILGVPVRFTSVVVVAFGSVALLAFTITAPDLFLGDLPPRTRLYVTSQALSVASVFGVVGAVTTDSLF
jgi:uncharacterized membrane protein